MPPKKDKDSNRDDVDSKYSIIFEKLDTLTTGKMESDKKLNMIISTQSKDYHTGKRSESTAGKYRDCYSNRTRT